MWCSTTCTPITKTESSLANRQRRLATAVNFTDATPVFRAGAPAVASPRGSRLGLENWKRSVRWRSAVAEIGREKLRVHDLLHTCASLSRRAGADLRLLQKAMGHASITVTAPLTPTSLATSWTISPWHSTLYATSSGGKSRRRRLRPPGQRPTALGPRCGQKLGNDSTTALSRVAMWLASDPE
jgi:hypothetical protein